MDEGTLADMIEHDPMTKEEVRQEYQDEMEETRKCPDCGADVKKSQRGFWYCSKVCWLKSTGEVRE